MTDLSEAEREPREALTLSDAATYVLDEARMVLPGKALPKFLMMKMGEVDATSSGRFRNHSKREISLSSKMATSPSRISVIGGSPRMAAASSGTAG